MNRHPFVPKVTAALCALILLGTLGTSASGDAEDTRIFLPVVAVGALENPPSETIIIDHRSTDIHKIPDAWIEQAKKLRVHLAHTSHGGQILQGMRWLESKDSKYNMAVTSVRSGNLPVLPDDLTAVRIYDGNNYESDTYITPEQYWESSGGREHTRSVLESGLFDVSQWTWCGQMSTYSVAKVQTYLDTMAQFAQDHPDVRMVLFTGHTDGSAPGSTLWRNNDLVRALAKQSPNAILFDFADIESYTPAGDFFPTANDSCPWCAGWCMDHPEAFECQNLPACAHSNGLQCTLKAQAYWWLLARLAGWDGSPSLP